MNDKTTHNQVTGASETTRFFFCTRISSAAGVVDEFKKKTQKGAKYGKQKYESRHRQKCRFRSYAQPPAHARVHARVVRQTQTGIYINNITSTNHAHACTHARDARRPFTQNEIDFWREQIFAESQEYPVKAAVEEAVKSAHKKTFAFGRGMQTALELTASSICTSSSSR